jgi:phosphoserine aminotransferase
MSRRINFDAGPAALPDAVLQEAAKAVIEYKHSGSSILEIAHRGPLFKEILEEANELVRSLLQLDDSYEVIWMQGGGRLQFAMVPMNFLDGAQTAGYIDSGHWAAEALDQAGLYGNTLILGSSRADKYRYVPGYESVPEHLSYLHFTTNNTIYGTQWKELPETNVPLIADMSSELFSRRLDYNKFSMLYAVAQKNIGPAGVTLVVIRKEMLEKQVRPLPGILSYRDMAEAGSVLNTPPVFAIYCSLLTLRWIQQKGLDAIEEENRAKAALLYDTIDNSDLFYGMADKESRSMMNVCFRLKDESLQDLMLQFAAARNITGIKGHRSVGGFRASLYNAISYEQTAVLANALRAFELAHK